MDISSKMMERASGVGAVPKNIYIGTDNPCMLCLKSCKMSPETQDEVILFCRIISRYFGVKFSVQHNTENSRIFDGNWNNLAYFDMCDMCRALGAQCVQAYLQLEVLQTKLHHFGQKVSEIVTNADGVSKNTRKQKQTKAMENVRNELETKCSAKSTEKKLLFPSARVMVKDVVKEKHKTKTPTEPGSHDPICSSQERFAEESLLNKSLKSCISGKAGAKRKAHTVPRSLFRYKLNSNGKWKLKGSRNKKNSFKLQPNVPKRESTLAGSQTSLHPSKTPGPIPFPSPGKNPNGVECAICHQPFSVHGVIEKYCVVDNLSHCLICPRCSVILLSHQDIKPNFSCMEIGSKTDSKESPSQFPLHEALSKSFSCIFGCKEQFIKGEALASHEYLKHSNGTTPPDGKCPRCELVHKSNNEYIKHFLIDHLQLRPKMFT